MTFCLNNDGELNLGSFKVIRTLGVGKQAKVVLAENDETKRKVALKVIDKKNYDRNRKHILNEISALKRINHPNVLRMSEVYDDVRFDACPKQAIVLVLDYCVNGELFDIMLATGGFGENLARTYFLQLVNAMSYCHSLGIFHRDLKPQNILLDADFQLKIADFGVSTSFLDRQNLSDTFCGTLSFMAPEMLARRLYSAEKADSWSLGIVLFILLAGNPPLRMAAGNDWWFKAILTRKMDKFWKAHEKISPNLPVSARAILSRLLVAEPKERSSIREISSDPWLKGATLSRRSLREEMGMRVKISRNESTGTDLRKYRSKEVQISEQALNA